jgi:hypothetical protein
VEKAEEINGQDAKIAKNKREKKSKSTRQQWMDQKHSFIE